MGPTWCRLVDQTGEVSTFLAPTWIKIWLKVFGQRLSTQGIIWENGGDPVGCVLISGGRGWFGPLPVSRSYLNASGASEVGCDHNDVVVVEEYRDAVVDDLRRVLLERRDDEVSLEGVRDRLFEELHGAWPSDTWHGFDSEASYVDLDRVRESGMEYLAHLSSNSRSQIRRSIRLYEERFGGKALSLPCGADEAVAWLEDLIDLHEATWYERGEAGAFKGRAKDFHCALVRAAHGAESGGFSADIVRVEFGDETIGLLYNTVYRGRVSNYQSGFQYHADGKLKPGLVTHALAVEEYLRRGAVEYDFLGGEPRPVQYKRSLSTDKRTLYWAQLPVPGLRMRALSALRRGKQAMQSIRFGDV